MINRLRNLFRTLRAQSAIFSEKMKEQRKCVFIYYVDAFISFVFFGSSLLDYVRYEFYKKSFSERNTFVTYRRGKKLTEKYCGYRGWKYQEKHEFNKRFDKYLNREWRIVKETAADDFLDFVKRQGKVIMKPIGGEGGHGIFFLTYDEYVAGGADKEQYKNYIAEEVLVQNKVLSEINPYAVNSIRVVTFDGNILMCALKLGTTNVIVDNMHSGGIAGNIDIETGITDTKFCNMSLEYYAKQPMTGKILLGVQMPRWEELKKTVTAAAKEFKEARYVGWDVAILEDGIAIIEANVSPGHDLVQQAPQRGYYKDIKRILKEQVTR